MFKEVKPGIPGGHNLVLLKYADIFSMKTENFRAKCLNGKLVLAKRSQDSSKVVFESCSSFFRMTQNFDEI